MDETKWLWGVEGSIILLNYGAYWLQEIWTFEFHGSPSDFQKSNIGWPQQPPT